MSYEQYPNECEANAETILAIPDSQLTDDEARFELFRRALDGQDVYAYTHVRPDKDEDDWVVWVRQQNPYDESRFAPNEWAEQWRQGLQPDRQEDV